MRQEDCYTYVRAYYGVNAYIGVRVCVRGRSGLLVKAPGGGDQYVYIRFDGDKRVSGPFHPTDEIEYRVATDAVTRTGETKDDDAR